MRALGGQEERGEDGARRVGVRAAGSEAGEVLQESLYRSRAIGRMDLALEVFGPIVALCSAVLPGTLADTDTARRLLSEVEGAGARDAIHVAVMLNHGIDEIPTFDRGFDRMPGNVRVPLD